MRTFLLIFLASLALAGPAWANAADDGNHALAAMNQGNYDEAIAGFTRAINRNELAGDDEEFAYANRGLAYLKKANYSLAISDLDHARQMKPDDVDAQNNLIAALQAELPASSIPNRPKQGLFESLGSAFLQRLKDGTRPQNGN